MQVRKKYVFFSKISGGEHENSTFCRKRSAYDATYTHCVFTNIHGIQTLSKIQGHVISVTGNEENDLIGLSIVCGCVLAQGFAF